MEHFVAHVCGIIFYQSNKNLHRPRTYTIISLLLLLFLKKVFVANTFLHSSSLIGHCCGDFLKPNRLFASNLLQRTANNEWGFPFHYEKDLSPGLEGFRVHSFLLNWGLGLKPEAGKRNPFWKWSNNTLTHSHILDIIIQNRTKKMFHLKRKIL